MAGDKYAALRAEFVDGMMSVADLARQHGLPVERTQVIAARQKWTELRQEKIRREAETIRKAEEKAMADAAESAAHERVQAREDANRRHRELAGAINGEIARAIKAARQAGEPTSASNIRALAGALESAQRVERLALGMTTEAHEVQADVRHQDAFLDGDALIKELQARGLPVDVLDVDAA